MAKIIIPRGLDIEELVYRNEIELEKAKRREELLKRIQYKKPCTKPLSEEEQRRLDKKVANYSQRKSAQEAEERRKAKYATIVSKKLEEER